MPHVYLLPPCFREGQPWRCEALRLVIVFAPSIDLQRVSFSYINPKDFALFTFHAYWSYAGLLIETPIQLAVVLLIEWAGLKVHTCKERKKKKLVSTFIYRENFIQNEDFRIYLVYLRICIHLMLSIIIRLHETILHQLYLCYYHTSASNRRVPLDYFSWNQYSLTVGDKWMALLHR